MGTNVIPFGPRNPATAATAGENMRTPPHNYDAERSLLGAILMNNRAFDKVSEFLRPEHFADPVNGEIFAVIGEMVEKGQQANPVTLKSVLDPDMVSEGGTLKYLINLAASAVTIINAKDYGVLIHEMYLRRETIDIATNLMNAAYEARVDESALDVIDATEQQLFNLTDASHVENRMVTMATAVAGALKMAEAAHRREGGLSGVTTGLRDLDLRLGGLHASDLLILAGRPSMGKTALATTMAFNAAQYYQTTDDVEHKGKLVAFFSLEMAAEQLATRILSQRAQIDSHRIRTGQLKPEEFAKLLDAQYELNASGLMIDDTPAASVSQIRTRCRRLARPRKDGAGHNLGMVVIDYLQLISPGNTKTKRDENRTQEVSAITRGLKALAKDLNVPVLALSQLSRAVEQREDKRPQLSDLRESGTIEADADVVMFAFREQYYLERAEPKQRPEESSERFTTRKALWDQRVEEAENVAECIIGKQRHGPVGIIKLHFDGPHTWFSDHTEMQMPDGRFEGSQWGSKMDDQQQDLPL